MLNAMSMCYDTNTTGYSGLLRATLMPIYLSISFFKYCNRVDIPNNDMRPVPDAKQVMTNINRFHEQVW